MCELHGTFALVAVGRLICFLEDVQYAMLNGPISISVKLRREIHSWQTHRARESAVSR